MGEQTQVSWGRAGTGFQQPPPDWAWEQPGEVGAAASALCISYGLIGLQGRADFSVRFVTWLPAVAVPGNMAWPLIWNSKA